MATGRTHRSNSVTSTASDNGVRQRTSSSASASSTIAAAVSSSPGPSSRVPTGAAAAAGHTNGVEGKRSSAKTSGKWQQAAAKSLHPQGVITGGQRAVLPKWMADDAVAGCPLCSKSFNITRRRHHCRACGTLVCQTCSARTLILPQTQVTKPQRVCDKCYEDRQLTSADEVAAVAAEANAEAQVEGDPRMRPHAIPPWTYAMKPFADKGRHVGIGRLYVRVIRAQNLPSMDIWGTSDPFCEVRLGEQLERTRVIERTLSPEWNDEFFMEVFNHTSTLRLSIFDHDFNKEDHVGDCLIALPQISHQLRHTQWYEIDLNDDVAAKQKEKENKDGFINTIISIADTSSSSSSSLSADKDSSKRPKIEVELHYTFSKVGEFFSHFNPEQEDEVPPPDFNIDILYGNVMQLLAELKPIFGVLGSIGGIIGWGHPYVSLAVLVIYIYIALHPWTLIVIVQLLLLRYMIWQYVYRIWERSADEERIKKEAERIAADEEAIRLKEEEGRRGHIISRMGGAVLGGVRDGAGLALKAGKGVLSVLPGVSGKPMDPDERAHLNGVVRSLANTSLAAIGMNASLGYYQQMLGQAADGVQTMYELFQWKTPATTRAIFVGILCTTIYSLFLPHAYLWLALGGAVLTCRTIPFQLLIWFIMGVIRYVTRARHNPQAVRDWDRVVAVTRAQRRFKRKSAHHSQSSLNLSTSSSSTSSAPSSSSSLSSAPLASSSAPVSAAVVA